MRDLRPVNCDLEQVLSMPVCDVWLLRRVGKGLSGWDAGFSLWHKQDRQPLVPQDILCPGSGSKSIPLQMWCSPFDLDAGTDRQFHAQDQTETVHRKVRQPSLEGCA